MAAQRTLYEYTWVWKKIGTAIWAHLTEEKGTCRHWQEDEEKDYSRNLPEDEDKDFSGPLPENKW